MPRPVPARRLPPARKLAYGLAASLILFLTAEGALNLLYLGVDYRREARKVHYGRPIRTSTIGRHDPELGWTFKPMTRQGDFYGPGRHLTINAEGLRSTTDYGPKPPGVYRVLCLGDSFTMGYGVGDESSYPARLSRTNPRVQALNMGMGGYSVGQCWMWYKRDGERFNSDLVVLALIADDVERLKYGLQGNLDHLPKFRLSDGKLEIYNVPVPEPPKDSNILGEAGLNFSTFLFRRSGVMRAAVRVIPDRAKASLRGGPEDFASLVPVALEIISDLDRQVRAHGGKLALALLPTIGDTGHPAAGPKYARLSADLTSHAEKLGIPFRDVRLDYNRLSRTQIQELFSAGDLHNNERGNLFVAQAINTWLEAEVPGYPKAIEDAARENVAATDGAVLSP